MEKLTKEQIEFKKCSRCNTKKPTIEFSVQKTSSDGLSAWCKECKKEYKSMWYSKNKENVKDYNNKWIENNKNYHSDLYINNIDKIKERNKKNKKITNKRYLDRRNTNPLFKFKSNLRNRTCQAFKQKKWKKDGSEKLLGCSYECAKLHIENKFTIGMSWDNYGEWHIDHIIPLSSAKDVVEMSKLCHYTNIQPLWAIDNIKKGNR